MEFFYLIIIGGILIMFVISLLRFSDEQSNSDVLTNFADLIHEKYGVNILRVKASSEKERFPYSPAHLFKPGSQTIDGMVFNFNYHSVRRGEEAIFFMLISTPLHKINEGFELSISTKKYGRRFRKFKGKNITFQGAHQKFYCKTNSVGITKCIVSDGILDLLDNDKFSACQFFIESGFLSCNKKMSVWGVQNESGQLMEILETLMAIARIINNNEDL